MMFAGVPVALLLLAQAADSAAAPADSARAVYGPAAPPAPKPAAAAAKPAEPCPTQTGNAREIVICAEKPQGFRIDPDVLKAKREKRSAGRPTRPGPIAMKDNSCTVVGRAPCMNAPMINLLGAAATLGEMGERLSKGEEIGSLFDTDPTPSEYQLYAEAKREREAKDVEKAKAATAKKAKAAAAVPAAKPAQ
ncbi:MAG: hypothetical protein ABI454_03100 [Sphingomicrobium sp.]